MRITFFKTNKPKQFKYIPRYYDEQKEEAEQRKRRISKELGIENNGAYQHGISRGTLSRKFSERKTAHRSSVIRLLVIVAILTMLVLFFISGSFNFLSK
ncbi:MAG: hypothetical protein JXB34_01785 [Bacteroidales bacterium]|nr:hypothetical protein [Bacteroidales bacterium]